MTMHNPEEGEEYYKVRTPDAVIGLVVLNSKVKFAGPGLSWADGMDIDDVVEEFEAIGWKIEKVEEDAS